MKKRGLIIAFPILILGTVTGMGCSNEKKEHELATLKRQMDELKAEHAAEQRQLPPQSDSTRRGRTMEEVARDIADEEEERRLQKSREETDKALDEFGRRWEESQRQMNQNLPR